LKRRNVGSMKIVAKIRHHFADGSTVIADMIPAVITVLVTGVLLFFYSSWVYNFETKEYINAIVREYILRMETKGYLIESDRNMLIEELQSKGLENLSLSGTTFTPVQNGEIVTLKISGEINYKKMKFSDIFNWNAKSKFVKKSIEITQSTTAIY